MGDEPPKDDEAVELPPCTVSELVSSAENFIKQQKMSLKEAQYSLALALNTIDANLEMEASSPEGSMVIEPKDSTLWDSKDTDRTESEASKEPPSARPLSPADEETECSDEEYFEVPEPTRVEPYLLLIRNRLPYLSAATIMRKVENNEIKLRLHLLSNMPMDDELKKFLEMLARDDPWVIPDISRVKLVRQ
ncbi:uncharacterized protein LOC119948142 isoform X2 [Tachyglossus aculeatus]|uniref:uncharacterized protein LOC119948142 isoform X2 n=1 Tax=Tachyglossus aculeatus TaxID=9261 RepID=UPI0018F455A2|nr:uncharacterized protein LOC119948142 isoform X2 [Tachyglossus aculeatus]